MKKSMIVMVAVLSIVKVHGQDPKTPKPEVQLFVVTVDHKRFITDSNGLDVKATESEAIQKGVVYINPIWIDSMSVIKGKEATDQFGTLARNGVVLMFLKKEALTEMAPENSKKFLN